MKDKRAFLATQALSVLALGASIVLARDDSEPHPRSAPTYTDHTKLMVVRDARGQEMPVASRADWDVRRDHILAHFQEVAGPQPGGVRRVPLGLEIVAESTREPGFTLHKRITFAAEPGDRVPAWLLIPDRASNRRAPGGRAVLVPHIKTIAMRQGRPDVGLGKNLELGLCTRALAAARICRTGHPTIPTGEYKLDVYSPGVRQCDDEGDLEQPEGR